MRRIYIKFMVAFKCSFIVEFCDHEFRIVEGKGNTISKIDLRIITKPALWIPYTSFVCYLKLSYLQHCNSKMHKFLWSSIYRTFYDFSFIDHIDSVSAFYSNAVVYLFHGMLFTMAKRINWNVYIYYVNADDDFVSTDKVWQINSDKM